MTTDGDGITLDEFAIKPPATITSVDRRDGVVIAIAVVSSVVAAVIRGHTRMLSGNFGRSQGIRRMLSAFTKNMIILMVIVCQIKHCEMVSTSTKLTLLSLDSPNNIRCGDMGIG